MAGIVRLRLNATLTSRRQPTASMASLIGWLLGGIGRLKRSRLYKKGGSPYFGRYTERVATTITRRP
jgi:hypothetical protein